jgi:hypothetical protein
MKVRAKNDDIKKVIRHPIGGAFREDGTAEWPDDSYTLKRIQEGDVISEDQPAQSNPLAPPEMKKAKKE